jgi:hypothetical protein
MALAGFHGPPHSFGHVFSHCSVLSTVHFGRPCGLKSILNVNRAVAAVKPFELKRTREPIASIDQQQWSRHNKGPAHEELPSLPLLEAGPLRDAQIL